MRSIILNSMKMITFPTLNAIEAIKIWSKRKLFNFRYRTTSKTRKSRKFLFFLLNHIVKLQLFCVRSFFFFLVFESWVKQSSKTWNSLKFHFFLLIHIVKLYLPTVNFCFNDLESWIPCATNIWSKKRFRDFRIFDCGCRVKSKTRISRKFSLFLIKAHH